MCALWRRWSAESQPKDRVLRILAYHRVLDGDQVSFPFHEGLISVGAETFRKQMEFVRRHFDVVSFCDLYRCDLEGRPWPKHSLIVTFDDGYRDNFSNAFPILKALDLNATVFLVTDHIGRSKLFWWDAIAYCVKVTGRRSVSLADVSGQEVRLESAADRREAVELILRWIKRVPEDVKSRFLEMLSRTFDVELPESLAEGLFLSWDEVSRMASGGIEFGSHTMSHPVLANVSETQLRRELTESKLAIEERLGREVLVVAYPVGGPAMINESVKNAAALAGYKFAASYVDSPVFETELDRFALPRIHVEKEHSLSLFRANVMFPRLMFGHRETRLLAFGRRFKKRPDRLGYAESCGE